jgi:hypothetical protein
MTGTNKLATLLAFIMALVLLAPGGAAADMTTTITDNTWMQPWYGHNNAVDAGYTSWNWRSDPIGIVPAAWEISKVDVTWLNGGNLQMKIYTNYPQAGLEGAGQADIALDPLKNGSWNVGIKMSGTDLGKIYTVSSWNTSETYWGGSGYIYTGRYDTLGSTTDPKVPNTIINQGVNNLDKADVTFGAGIGSDYLITIDFPTGFNALGNWDSFNFEVSSGSCGNDTMFGNATGQAPTPASVLLLGTGLVGLAGLKWRRRKQQS